MQYLFLLYSDESQAEDPPKDPAAFADYMAPWVAYNEALTEAGVMRGGEALLPSAMATTLTNHGGKAVHTDGPFAASKEQLGGFYMVECKDLDEALAWAAKCPAAAYGSVEVRPIMDLGEFD
ncbi:MAG: YciI family protein [Sandaracinaceae bacterium]